MGSDDAPSLSASSAILCWAANKRFGVSKFKFKLPRARNYELFRARSRLYRSQILQVKLVNTRWKALVEIYTMHSFAPFWNVLVGSVWVKKYTKINIEKMKSGKS